MLEYLTKLPSQILGHNVLGYLELIDIIQWENAGASHESQQLLREILRYCPPIVLFNASQKYYCNKNYIHWFIKRRCHIEIVEVDVESIQEAFVAHSIVDNIKLNLNNDTCLEHVMPLQEPSINRIVTHLNINMNQDPAVMQELFSQLSHSNSVRSLVIESSNLSQWMKHIQKIGPFLLHLTIGNRSTKLSMITTITEYCPYLEKLNCIFESDVSDSNILQSIANNCPHIRNLDIKLMYDSSVLADADLTAFAEKCPQLEELSLTCQQLTDQSVIVLAQHCSRLKKLKTSMCKLTAVSLIALSERGLPLEELDIPEIPIHSAEIAAKCAHALSRIRDLSSFKLSSYKRHVQYALQYMTRLRTLNLWKSEDLLVLHLLLVQQQRQYCAGLERLFIGPESGITPQQTYEIVKGCRNLHTIYINKDTCTSDAVIVKLANNCPHLQNVTLYCSSEVTEEGVLTLAAHCRQLKVLELHGVMLSVENVRQIAFHCRRLTKLNVRVYRSIYMEGIVEYNKYYTRKEIRALRENPR